MVDSSKWTDNNEKYWGSIAYHYSKTYSDEWSMLENSFVLERLRYVQGIYLTNILDLGCGTGLGYLLCRTLNSRITYTGVDISNEMLDALKINYPDLVTFNSKMSDLRQFKPKSFNFIISIFTSFSYTDKLEKTVNEISRVLGNDGAIFISVISKYSLRRIFKLKFGKREKYKTRNITSNDFSYSWVFTRLELLKLFSPDFTNIEIIGYNPFGGLPFLAKYPSLWKINLIIAKLFPNFSHELILTANKKISA